MSHKQFKLVPIKHFQRLIELDKENSIEKDCVIEGTSKIRSIKSIVEGENEANKQNTEEQLEFQPSSHYTADMKISRGGANTNNILSQDIPIFLPNASTLPELSKANVMKHSFEDIKSLLQDSNIPDKVKVKLLHIYQNRYENDKRIAEDFEDIQNTPSNHNQMITKHYVIDKAVYNLKTSKQIGFAEKIKDIILAHSDDITWDNYGNIISPKTTPTLNLNTLFQNLQHHNKGSASSIAATVKIIEKIYKYIEPYIQNAKVKTQFKKINSDKRLSKYIPW